MIDMKKIKENVTSRIKTYQEADKTVIKENKLKENKPKEIISKEVSVQSNSAIIGASIRIKGDVTGDEDLIIQGHVEGTINLQGHNVTISKSAKVTANIQANQIIVEGDLIGDMNGDQKVVIRETGNVYGNIVAPRVTLEDGAMFKGSIEMEPLQEKLSNNKNTSSLSLNKENVKLKVAP